MAYTKKVWETGQIIEAPDLNNMEDGIEANAEAIEGLQGQTDTIQNTTLPGLTTKVTGLETDVGTIKDTTIPAINQKVEDLETAVGEMATSETIVNLRNDVDAIKDTTIPAIQESLADKADKTTVDTLSGTVQTINETTIPGLTRRVQTVEGNQVDDLTVIDGKIYLKHDDAIIGTGVDFSSGVGFDGGYVDADRKLHLTMEGTDVEGFEPFEVPETIHNVSYDANHYLHFKDATGNELYDGPFLIEGGTGQATYNVRLENHMTSSVFSVASSKEQRTLLKFTYTEYFGNTLQTMNGFMTVQYKLSTDTSWNNVIGMTNVQIPSSVMQTIDVTDMLAVSADRSLTTNIRIVCSNGREDDKASADALSFSITTVPISIVCNFDQTATYTGNFGLQYTCIGYDLNKTVRCFIDDKEYRSVNVGKSHNKSLSMQVEMTDNYEYGAHNLKLWFELDDGAKSNILEFIVLYNNGDSTATIIGATLSDYTIENGEQVQLNYVCFTPGQEKTDELNIRVYDDDGTEYFTANEIDVPNNVMQTPKISNYPDKGKAYIEISSGSTVTVLEFEVTDVTSDYDLTSITTGLVYSYKPIGYTNNSTGKEQYVYKFEDAVGNECNVYTRMTGFNWVTDGYLGGDALTLTGSARMNIDLPILSTWYENADGDDVMLDSQQGAKVVTKGRTMEFEFELSDVTNQNTPVFTCMNEDGVGFVITPQVCYLLADGQQAVMDSTGFIENEDAIPCAYIKDEKRIRVSFVIEPWAKTASNDFISHANIYINGEYANSFLYDEKDKYDSNAIITIGSKDCVTKLYDVRLYNIGLDRTQVLQNHKNSSVDIRERIAENEYNDVLDNSKSISYVKARLKYPCLLFIGRLSNTKADTQYVGVVLTKPDGHGGYKTEFSLLDRDDTKFIPSIKVQGTSSQKFMRKNFKVKLEKNKYEVDEQGNPVLDEDGHKIITGTEKVKYALKGKDSSGNNLSVPESTLCFKMDYMSTDHANTFNANIADTLFEDRAETFAGMKNANILQNTIWGFRCLLFNMSEGDFLEGFNREEFDQEKYAQFLENLDFNNYADGVIAFAGDGCLNNDKSNSKSFGLETEGDSGANTKEQKWEFKDNSKPLCTFTTDRMMTKISSTDTATGITTWRRSVRDALESCYPDEGDLDKAGIEPKYDYVQALFTWVYQRANFWDASAETTGTYTYNGQSYTNERDYKKAIFTNEFTRHFNMEHALVYYLFIEWVALADNRAKNMFLSCKDTTVEHLVFTDSNVHSIWDIVDDETGAVDASKIDWENSTFCIWYTDLYDLDSCFGVENSGYLNIPYYADWTYYLGGRYQFNGHDSRLWCMFEEAMGTEIKERAQRLANPSEGTGTLNHTVLTQTHITENANLVCPTIVNEDMVYKYEAPWTEGYIDYSKDTSEVVGDPTQDSRWTKTHEYQYLLRGSRTEQKESFIYRRSMMLYSKYQTPQFTYDQITFRCGAPLAREDTKIDLKAIQSMYMGIKYGDSNTPVMSTKKAAGETAELFAPDVKIEGSNVYVMKVSDTVYIMGATNLTDISSLAAFKPYEIQLQNAKKLKTLLIGSNAYGYSNDSLKGLDTSACSLLDTLNIRGCNGILNAINLRNNKLIRVVLASGSSAPAIYFANGGILETLELGAPTSIELRNQKYLTDFSYDSLNNLNYLYIENTPNTGMLDIVSERLSSLTRGLRLVNIDEVYDEDNYDIFKLLTSSVAQGKQLNAEGDLVTGRGADKLWPVITGTIRCNAIGQRVYELMQTYYPDLQIKPISQSQEEVTIIPEYEVSFWNMDGNPILDKSGAAYIQYVEAGQTILDPVYDTGEIDPPELKEDEKYTYTWSGWDNISGKVTGPRRVVATYDTEVRTYTVRWYAQPGRLLKTVENVEYGAELTYSDDPYDFPTMTTLENNGIYYVFTGWDKSTGHINGNTDVYAKWDTASLPPAKGSDGYVDLKDMTIAQIYAVARERVANNYWENRDYIDIVAGADFDFDTSGEPQPGNVRSEVLMNEEFFDGTRAVDTGIRLFGEDAPTFTLAIDYEFISNEVDSTLVSCISGNAIEGFRLRYNQNPNIQWGDRNNVVGSGYQRGIIVIRHEKGSQLMQIMTNGTTGGSYNKEITNLVMYRTTFTPSDVHLAFGGVPFAGNTWDYYAKGWIHWCKIWYDDLGNTVCERIANWPHETWRMEFCGAERYRLTGGTAQKCAASFVANSLSYLSYAFGNRELGWGNSPIRNFLNDRCFAALPTEWQVIIRAVMIPAIVGETNSSTIEYSEDKIYIPSYSEYYSTSTAAYLSEGSLYGRFNSVANRVTAPAIIIPSNRTFYDYNSNANYANDPTVVTSTGTVKDGDVWRPRNYSLYYYLSAETVAKLGYVSGRSVTSSEHLKAQGQQGGLWVYGYDYVATRTKPTGYSYSYWYRINPQGSGSFSSNPSSRFYICFSI